MKRKLPQSFAQIICSNVLLIGMFVIGYNQNVVAQCFITTVGTVNSSTLFCHTSPLNGCDNGTLTIGNGSAITNIYMDAELNLTCLGAVQVIVKSMGSFDFSPGNNRLYLAEGSSIIFEVGSSLIGGSCNASERIYIGTNLLASCNGGAGADISFTDLLGYGGTGSLASNSPVCIGSQISLTATPPPTPTGTFTYSFSGPGLAATSYSSSPTYSFTATAGTTGIYQVKIKNSNITNPLIAEKSVTVNSLPTAPTILAGGPTTFCEGGSVTLTSSVGSGNLWSTAATTTNISPTTSGSYTVRVTNANGCQSASSVATVVSVTTIAAPTGAATQSFCLENSPTVANLTAIGTALKWYAVPSGGSALATTIGLVDGTHYYASQTVSGCESLSRFDVIASVSSPAVPTGTASQTFCSGAMITSLSVTGSGILWYAASNGGSPLVTSTVLVDGTHYFASQTVSGCESVARFDVSVTINTAPSAPLVPSTLSIGCVATAFMANWTASASATNYYFDVATDAGFTAFLSSYNNINLGNVISENVTGLTVGSTFYVRLRAENSCGTSANSSTIVVSVPTTTYSAGVWDNGMPDITEKAVFASAATITTQLDACSCQINAGVNVVVGVPGALNDTAILKLENGLNVMGSATLTFENNASLVQVNSTAVNTGNITYKRKTTAVGKFDYTFWSSPVSPQQLENMSPNTLDDKFFSRNAATNMWVPENHLNFMTAGKGYIARGPQENTIPAIYEAPFVGVPNNGDILVPIVADASNLIGNPYPSAIDADLLVAGNPLSLDGTFYFWTHNTPISGNKYSANDYAVYTNLGGVGTRAALSSGVNNSLPSGEIAAGQSFMAVTKVGAIGPVNFKNTMRLKNDGAVLDNSQFFKGTKSKTVAVEKHRVWLNLTNTEGAFKQMLVGYVTGGTNGFDFAFDVVSLNSNKYIDFYSVNDNKNLVVQGRALPFDKADKIPLGYKTTIEGTFSINIDQADGLLADQDVFIMDKDKGTIHNLKNGAYYFSTLKGVFNDRFVLRFIANDIVYSTLTAANLDKPVIVSVQNHLIKINSFDEIMDKLFIYDLNGRLLYKNEYVNSNEFTIPDFISSKQFLIVKTLLKNGEWFTTEIIF